MVKKKATEEKKKGKVYTPDFIVCNILDMIGYNGNKIIKKSIIDNSCGDGAFLKEIVKRYCNVYLQNNLSVEELKNDLEKYIFGIEIDEAECLECKKNLDNVANQFNIKNINWNVICANTLTVKEYDGKMDYVVGNPPYVRVHNLDNLNEIKSFQFSKEGMTDLYIVFFEIGLNMLSKNGILGYITPSSYFTSKSGRVMREYITQKKLLTDIVDLKHNQVFNAMTYSCITILNTKNIEPTVNYYEYDLEQQKPYFIDKLTSNDYVIDNCFYFSQKKKLSKLKSVLSFTPIFSKNEIQVKNGFATLFDDFFIKDNMPFTDYIIPVLKSSTGKWKKCFYPYKNGKLISLDVLQQNEEIKKYYASNTEQLKKRTNENPNEWWGFGRTQGLNDVSKMKYSINSLVKTPRDLKIMECESGSGVYSGLYILTDIEFDKVKNALISDDFIEYVSLLGKYKSGGYYTFSSKDVKKYLEYSLLKG